MTGKQEGPYKGEETQGKGRQSLTTVLQGFSLLFKDVLFGFFNIQKDKINEYFIINLLLLHRIHRRKFTHKKITHKKEVQQYIHYYFIFQEP